MGAFVKDDFGQRHLCGCALDGSHTCAGHIREPQYQRAYRAPVEPIRKLGLWARVRAWFK